MIDTFKTYFQKHFAFESLFGLDSADGAIEEPEKSSLSRSKRMFIVGLKLSPYLCGLVFVLSFFPFFKPSYTYEFSVFGFKKILGFADILTVVSVGGLIGFGTNWLAIKMLFRPVNRRPLWGQGLIPAQKDRIIYSLAQGMYNHILNQDLIRQRVEETGIVKKVNDLVMEGTIGLIKDDELRGELKQMIYEGMEEYATKEEVRKEIREMIDNRLENNLDKGFKKILLQTYKRFNKEDYEEVINKVVADLPKIAMEVMDKLEDQLDRGAAFLRLQKKETAEQIMNIFIDVLNRIDIADLLTKQMAHFDEQKLEQMVWESTNEELRYIQYLGTLLGMLGGLLIWEPVIMLSAYGFIFLTVLLLDGVLFQFTSKPESN